MQIARIAPDPAELDRLTSQAREYILAAKSQATLRAYRADWKASPLGFVVGFQLDQTRSGL